MVTWLMGGRDLVHLIPESGKTQSVILREDRFPTKPQISTFSSGKKAWAPSGTEPTQLDRIWKELSPGGHKATRCSRVSAEEATQQRHGQLGSDSRGSQGRGSQQGLKKDVGPHIIQRCIINHDHQHQGKPRFHSTRSSSCPGVHLGSSQSLIWTGFHHCAIAVQSTGSGPQMPTLPLSSYGISDWSLNLSEPQFPPPIKWG